LEGIVSQLLLPEINSKRSIVATEVLIPTLGIRNLIRDKKDHQIYSLMQTGQNRFGMHTMNQSLVKLLAQGKIDYESAVSESPDLSELKEILRAKGISRIGSGGNQGTIGDHKSAGKHDLRDGEQTGCLFTDLREETLSKEPSFLVRNSQKPRTL